MSENKTNWLAIVSVVIVVAVLASFLTVNLTGNVIRVNDLSKFGKYQVYTTQEIDAKLKALSIGNTTTTGYTKSEVDAKFSAFETSIQEHLAGKYTEYVKALIAENSGVNVTVRSISSADKYTVYGNMTCQQLCKTTLTNKGDTKDITNQNCLFGVGYENDLVKTLDHDMCSRLIMSSIDQYGDKISCVCG